MGASLHYSYRIHHTRAHARIVHISTSASHRGPLLDRPATVASNARQLVRSQRSLLRSALTKVAISAVCRAWRSCSGAACQGMAQRAASSSSMQPMPSAPAACNVNTHRKLLSSEAIGCTSRYADVQAMRRSCARHSAGYGSVEGRKRHSNGSGFAILWVGVAERAGPSAANRGGACR